MTKLVLPGGTDVAEMALFDAGAMPADGPPHPADFEKLEAQRSVMRFPTGADGGYLLHAYLDEALPADVAKYCVTDDCKVGVLDIASGPLAFGGLESLYTRFKPNPNIRADATVPSASYDVTAYRTEYPGGLIEAAIASRLGPHGMRRLALPGHVIPLGLGLATLGGLVMAIAAGLAWGGATALLAVLVTAAVLVRHFRDPTVKHLTQERQAVQIAHPSIVVHMRTRTA